jgi:tetratricopeptide (TPR) repeat protein
MARPSKFSATALFWLCLLSVGLLYAATFNTPWVYDDIDGIRQNPALRSGAGFSQILNGNPPDSTPYGRPLVSLSLALNHAASGFAPWSYRLLNLSCHLAAALTLARLVRLLLEARSGFSLDQSERAARWAALLFAAHPLATTVVTYTVQRAEGLMALLYLATLAAAARGLSGAGGARWRAGAVGLCAAGMLAKETMVTAPLAVLIVDRAFFAGSWREVARRWRWHLSLISTLAVLAACMLAWPRRQSVGFGSEDMGSLAYLNLQAGAWWHYLSLLVAPWRIAIDHWPVPSELSVALAAGLIFGGLYIAAIVLAWRRSPALGGSLILPGLVLLPTSTLIPIFTSPVADHRMYLPAAFALALVAVGICSIAWRWAPLFLIVAIAALGADTVARNHVFRSERAVWSDAVAHESENARALNNLGMAIVGEGHADEGEKRIAQALALNPGYPDAWYNLGTLQGRDGRMASAEESFGRALVLRPGYAAAHCNLAVVLWRRGKQETAIAHYEEAIRLCPDYPAANFNLAVIYLERRDYARALALAQNCLRGDPDYPKGRELVADLTRLAHP